MEGQDSGGHLRGRQLREVAPSQSRSMEMEAGDNGHSPEKQFQILPPLSIGGRRHDSETGDGKHEDTFETIMRNSGTGTCLLGGGKSDTGTI